MPLPFSVVILTLNEERDLPRCLESVAGCADVVVLDSGSTDRTGQIAEAAGARVFTRPFDTFAGQRNYAQSQIPFRNPWVFHLDADEAMTPDLAAECSAAVSREDLDGYWAAPRMMFQGRWVPHCTDYPAWQARFVRAPQFQFIDVGHGQREASSMRMARLKAGTCTTSRRAESPSGWTSTAATLARRPRPISRPSCQGGSRGRAHRSPPFCPPIRCGAAENSSA